ncbi:hypothetical protein QA612_12760 [Evansella sp. AB-P1]|uniref:hypothetical protein n=1 Tax=Evansella sp. AB-P1 TaxID=3037653 RepID=UPI00241F5E11|nr:hypothetical protein [Evansella sp. AB-P1]MDG5788354.1 hypothetical protein [Evansella sp. AB-P1]
MLLSLIMTLGLVACNDDEGREESSSGTNVGDTESEGYFEVILEGEEMEYDSITCREMGERFQMELGIDGFSENDSFIVGYPRTDNLEVREYDFEKVTLVSLFIDHGGETIGDGESYSIRDVEHIEGITISGDGMYAEGKVVLEAERNTKAEELNPEGGTVEFELNCGA